MAYNLEVRFGGNAQALLQLERAAKDRDFEVALSFDGESLEVDAAGVSQSFPAAGTWSGTVVVRRGFLKALRFSAVGQTSHIRVDGERLWLGSMSIPCSVHPQAAPEVFVPVNPSLAYLLALRAKHDHASLAASGVVQLVREAEEKRDKLLAKAAELLSPLGVDQADLKEIVERALKRRFQ